MLLEKDSGSADEHGSIGTVATRASIIEGLIQHGYLVRDERGGTLSATEKALSFFRMIPEAIRGVDLTARWWLMQLKVAAGELDPEAIMADVAREFEAHKASAYEGQTLLPVAGACPRCGADVVGRGKTWSCSSNVERKDDEEGWCLDAGCRFKLHCPSAGMRSPENRPPRSFPARRFRSRVSSRRRRGKSSTPRRTSVRTAVQANHHYRSHRRNARRGS